MKKLILTAIAGAVTSLAYAQQISPFVINSSGNSVANSYAGLSANIGEVAITKVGNSAFHITQGFLQPQVDEVSIHENSMAGSFVVFPNPTSTSLNVRSENVNEKLSMKLIDGIGRVVLQEELTEKPVSVADLQNGIYQLIIFNSEQKVVEHKTITKID